MALGAPYEKAEAELTVHYPGLHGLDAWSAFWADHGGYPGAGLVQWFRDQGAVGVGIDEVMADYFDNIYVP